MTPRQLRAALARLGLSQVGAAKALGIGDRTMREYVDERGDGPPGPVAAAVRAWLMLAKLGVDPAEWVANPRGRG